MSASLRLRPVGAQDAARLLEWRNRPEVSAFMYGDRRLGEDEHAAWMATVLAREGRRDWIVEVDATPVGLASLVRIDPHAARAEWGFYLADPATRGRGAGLAMGLLLLDHAFGPLGLNKVWSEVLSLNAAGLALHAALGFTREASLREQGRKGGVFIDAVGFGVLAREWAQVRQPIEARARAAFPGGLALKP